MFEGNGCAKKMNNSGLKRVNYCQALFIYKFRTRIREGYASLEI